MYDPHQPRNNQPKSLPQWQVLAPIEELYADFVEPRSPVVITAALLFPQTCIGSLLPEHIALRVAQGHPRFTSRLITLPNGCRIFQPTEFNMNEHVIKHRINETKNGKLLKSDDRKKGFEQIIGNLMERHLDEKKLWELHWIEGFGGEQNKNGTTAVLRVHHCVADGMALTEYLMHCVINCQNDNKKVENIKYKQFNTKKQENIFKWFIYLLWTLWMILKAIFTTLTVFWKDQETVLTSGNVSSYKVVAAQESAPNFIPVLKRVAKTRGATINDILMASVTGAVRTYLTEKGEDCDRLQNLYCGIAFNQRALYSNEYDVDNKHAVTFMSIPIGEANFGKRFDILKERLDELKRGYVVPMTVLWIWLLGKLPVKLRRYLWYRFTGKISLVVSNLKGPSDQVVVDTYPVCGIWPFAPHDGQCTLAVTIISYNGKVAVSFTSDGNRVPDPQRMLTLFNKEMDRFISYDSGSDMNS